MRILLQAAPDRVDLDGRAAVLDRARHPLDHDYRIDHAIVQVEPESHTGCHQVTW